jgi:hypothetical protein
MEPNKWSLLIEQNVDKIKHNVVKSSYSCITKTWKRDHDTQIPPPNFVGHKEN